MYWWWHQWETIQKTRVVTQCLGTNTSFVCKSTSAPVYQKGCLVWHIWDMKRGGETTKRGGRRASIEEAKRLAKKEIICEQTYSTPPSLLSFFCECRSSLSNKHVQSPLSSIIEKLVRQTGKIKRERQKGEANGSFLFSSSKETKLDREGKRIKCTRSLYSLLRVLFLPRLF